MSNVLSQEQQARIALTNARLRVNDFHACSTAEELDRWRSAQSSLIKAAGAVELARLQGQACATCRFDREDRPACDKGVVVIFGPAFGGYNRKVDFGCKQWAPRDPERPETV